MIPLSTSATNGLRAPAQAFFVLPDLAEPGMGQGAQATPAASDVLWEQLAGWIQELRHSTEAIPKPDLSFVIPVRDEAESLEGLVQGILAATTGQRVEIILVDDGSADPSWSTILGLRIRYPGQVRGLKLRGNHGKTMALRAGFQAARAAVIFTMDGDQQDDPAEIPNFLSKLDAGYDLVSGWKQVRHDPWHKVWPSRIFNWMLSKVSGVSLHDHNCGFKCYRAEVVKTLKFRGEQHRVLAALAGFQGFKAGEIPVKHQPRRHGQSKYGMERLFRGFCDILTVAFLRRYGNRPAHLVQKLALGYGLLTASAATAGALHWNINTAWAQWLPLGLLTGGFALHFCCLALLAELVMQRNEGNNTLAPLAADTGLPRPLPERFE